MTTTATIYFKDRAYTKSHSHFSMAAAMLYKAYKAKNEDKVGLATALVLSAFSPITNKNKLNNGATPRQAATLALQCARSFMSYGPAGFTPFGLTDDERVELIALSKAVELCI